MDNPIKLTQIVESLISSKREGVYWDFKEQPHENKAALLHDILCLANCLYKGNRYLIYGITDPDKGCQVVGLNQGQVNRKKQADLIDFIRSQDFAGDNRPVIEMKTIEIEGKEIDVVIISNEAAKPYYLSKDYKDKDKIVRSEYIYTRTNDSNTPINKGADIFYIEKMWRERFGLDLTPVEKMKILLERPNEWMKDIGNKNYAYHQQFPEYRIEFSNPVETEEVYSLFYSNHKSFMGIAAFKYHTTILFELEYIYCDEMRIVLSYPKCKAIKAGNYSDWFYYYNMSDLDGLFLYFLTDGSLELNSRSSHAPFLLFQDENEMKSFIEYVENNENELENIEPHFIAHEAIEELKRKGRSSSIDPLFLSKIKIMYERWIKLHN